jgi:hypothetical protein
MLKIKKIKLSGFRGILNPQELDLTEGGGEPRSLAMFGLNSSGKTSFVDGCEWFLSPTNEIEWLRREDAKEKAYPHQAAQDKGIESFVEVNFYDTANKIKSLTKTYDHNAVRSPTLSDINGFKDVYAAFVIRPYFRYLEVIDFVVDTAGKKYEKLAQWMGFENEFAFQEKLAVKVAKSLKDYEEELASKTGVFEQKVKQLAVLPTATNAAVLAFCNEILKYHKITECKNIDQVWEKVPEISKKKIA